MKNMINMISAVFLGAVLLVTSGCSGGGAAAKAMTVENGSIKIPVSTINDGKAHHFEVQAGDGTKVAFFTLKSKDGVIRAAIDACDVCYKSGLGYYQEGDYMVCKNCGQKFASNKINEIKGGCNPAPLNRQIKGDNLLIAMADINANSWYMRYRK
jgi:uncharacterized membrane protein